MTRTKETFDEGTRMIKPMLIVTLTVLPATSLAAKEIHCILIPWDEVEDGCRTWDAFTLPLREEGGLQ
jgi:hypothetical protein